MKKRKKKSKPTQESCRFQTQRHLWPTQTIRHRKGRACHWEIVEDFEPFFFLRFNPFLLRIKLIWLLLLEFRSPSRVLPNDERIYTILFLLCALWSNSLEISWETKCKSFCCKGLLKQRCLKFIFLFSLLTLLIKLFNLYFFCTFQNNNLS